MASRLKPLLNFKTIKDKNISNPYLFRESLMVTTFLRSADSRTKDLWRFLEKASQPYIRLAELEHPSHKKIISFLLKAGSHLCASHYTSETSPETAELQLNSALDP